MKRRDFFRTISTIILALTGIKVFTGSKITKIKYFPPVLDSDPVLTHQDIADGLDEFGKAGLFPGEIINMEFSEKYSSSRLCMKFKNGHILF